MITSPFLRRIISSWPLTASTTWVVDRERRRRIRIGEERQVMIALFTDLADEGAVAGLEALPKVFKRWVNRLHPFCSNGFWHCAVGGRHRAGLQHSLGAAKQRHRSDFALKCSGRFVAVC